MDNDFIDMEDSLAIMELAGMCTMFDGQNYKYAGVCYNNIANLQFKNKKYNLAKDNFSSAVQLADVALKNKEAEEYKSTSEQDDYIDYLNRVRAHRYYQYVMCRYKMLKY
jgi:hypothetical protein